jgi:trimethylamine-N-oxide reductase (cytochrome c)
MFVYVKDGRIIRITPIEFDSDDAPSFTIQLEENLHTTT